MTIAAKISSTELTAQVTNRFSGKFLEARLINATGTSYIPGSTDDTAFLGFEVTAGLGGYTRQAIQYEPADILVYSDDGVPLNRKATIFAHDGSGDSIDFSHVALVWSGGNATAISTPSTVPSAGIDGTYTNIPTTTGAAGEGLTVDLTIQNSGASSSDYILTLSSSGVGYVDAELLAIPEGVLVGLGAVAVGAGPLGFSVSTVSAGGSDTGKIVSVAETTSPVVLTGGNEAVFYWDLKQFGYYSS